MRRLLVTVLCFALVATAGVTVAGAARPSPAACAAKLRGGQPPMSRTDAVLLCAQPTSAAATVAGRWSTCRSTPPGPDEDCETGSWSARYRSTGALRSNGLSRSTMTWLGKAMGTLTCRRDRANTDPDVPGTPLVERFHRTGTFPIGQVTVAAAPRGSRVVVTVDGAVVRAAAGRAVEACGLTVLGNADPTIVGKGVDPAALLRTGSVRTTTRRSGTVGTVAALVGGPVRGSLTVTATVAFRG